MASKLSLQGLYWSLRKAVQSSERKWISHSCCRHSSPAKKNQREKIRKAVTTGGHICKCFINSSKTSIVRHRNSHSRGFTGLSAQHSSELRRRWIIRIFPHSCCRHSSPAKKNQRKKILKAAAGAVNDAFYDLSIHTFKVARQLGYALETSEMKSSQRGA